MKKRHLCIVTETYLPEVNGVANSLQRLFQHINDELYSISIVRTAPRTEHQPSYAETWVRGLTIPQYPDLQIGLPAARKLRRLWRDERPDILYIATEGLLGNSALSVAKEYGIPVLSAFHTNFLQYSGYYRMGWLQNLVMIWMRRFHNRCDVTLVPSRLLRDHLIDENFERVEWLPHGVDCQAFDTIYRNIERRKRWGIKHSEIVLLFVGRIAPEKNLQVALNSWLDARQQGYPVRMVVIGDGPMREQIEAEYPDIIFTGLQTGRDLSECYASADIFLMPSKTETFGLVTLEAMASGLPVVAFNLAAAAEFVREGIDGYLAKNGSQEAFTEALVNTLDNDPILMGVDARAQAERAAWHAVARRFEQHCECLLAPSELNESSVVQALQNVP